MPVRSSRLDNLPPYIFSVISDRIQSLEKQGLQVFRLDMGNPDMPPPQDVIDKLAMAANDPGNHGYIGYRGKATFRQAIAEHYEERFGVSLNPDTEVLPLIGSKEGLVNLSLAYLATGDLGLVPSVGYPAYEMGIRLAGGDIEYIKLNPDDRYLPDFGSVDKAVLNRAKMMWINYPNNPTGNCVSLDDLKNIAENCKKYDIMLVSDNPYVNVTFDENQGHSVLQAADNNVNIVEFLSFSKSYNMGGWRLGAVVGSSGIIKNLLQIKSNMDSGHFGPIYDAGITALKTPQSWIDERNAIYQSRRDKILAALPDIGLKAEKPGGTLYVWAKTLDFEDSAQYVEGALVNAQVSLGPGAAYGPGGAGFVRISLGVPDDDLEIALLQLKQWYAGRDKHE